MLQENSELELSHGVVEWIYPDGTKSVQPLVSILSTMKADSADPDLDHCFYRGNVYGDTGSIVALNLCNGLHGFIQTGNDGYVITPVEGGFKQRIESGHEIVRVKPISRPVEPDTMNKRRKRNSEIDEMTGDEGMFTWYEADLDSEMEKQDDLADLEWEGYVADKVWQVSLIFYFLLKHRIYINSLCSWTRPQPEGKTLNRKVKLCATDPTVNISG